MLNILSILMILKATVFFVPPTQADKICGEDTNGCVFYSQYWTEDKTEYMDNNRIYLDYSSSDINQTLWHEVGHMLFDNDEKVQTITKDYKPLYFSRSDIDEKTADYYAEYRLNNKSFSVKYPILYIYFRDFETGLQNIWRIE